VENGEAGPNVFIAHNSRDKEDAVRLAQALEFEDMAPRIDEWEVTPGDSFVKWMEKTLSESKFLILVWSKNAAESEWVKTEWSSVFPRLVNDSTIKIIPIRLDDEPLPELLRDLVYVRFEENLLNPIKEIVKAVYGPSRRSHREALAAVQKGVLEDEDPIPVVVCPRCGSLEVSRKADADEFGSHLMLIAECQECDWSWAVEPDARKAKVEEKPPYDNEPWR
jgi:hypothetical protein